MTTTSTATTLTIDPERGIQGKACFRPACQKPESAVHQHKISKRFYCDVCAAEIQDRYKRNGKLMRVFDSLSSE